MVRKVLSTFLTISLLLITQIGFGQAPEGVNYQAVARDGSGDALTNTNLTVRMTIKEGGPAGTTVYQETHNTNTNDFGLFDLVVGQGSTVTGTFSNIDWGNSSFFLQVEVDDGSGYVNLGTTQFVSVPYALYAKEAGNAGTSYNAGNGINISGNTIENTGDTDPTDDITNTSNAGGDVSGNFNNLTVEGIQGRPVSSSAPGNDQVLKWNGSEWAPANDVGGGSGDDWGSQVVQSDATLTGDGTSGSPLSVDGDLSDDQTLSISGNDLSISGGNTVTLPGGGSGDITAVNAGSGLSGGGTSGSVTLDADHDNAIWNADELQGNTVSNSTPSNGEVLKWNGSAWAPATDATGGGGSSLWTESGGDIYYNSGQVAIGHSSASEALDVDGTLELANGGEAFDLDVNSSGDLEIRANTTDLAMYITDTDQNVGIGTNNPSHRLHVEGGKAMIGSPNGVIAKMTVNSTETDEEIFRGRKNGSTQFIINEDGHVGIQDGSPANELTVNGSIDITDNLGIGTDSPQEDIVVHKASGPEMIMRNTSGSGEIGYLFSSQPGLNYSGMTFDVSTDVMDFYNNHSGGVITFSTDGGNERMRVSSGGGVGIGESSPTEDLEVGDADNSGTTRVQIGSGTDDGIDIGSAEGIVDGGSNTLEFDNADLDPDTDNSRDIGNSSTAWEDIYSTNGVTITSDRNAKDDIRELDYGLGEIMALKPVSYKLKNSRRGSQPHLGLVAQDVNEVISEVVKTHDWVQTEESGEWKLQKLDRIGINYTKLIPVLINSIQEQQGQIDDLKDENQQLKQRLNSLEKRVEQLEK